jgi:3-hydroxybutyryl-CoA dehydrogenase
LTQLDAAQQLAQLSVVSSLDDLDWSSVDLVIECIPERLDIKQALFKQLEQRARKDALLASNSSSFPITAIAQGLQTQERMLGLHFLHACAPDASC